MLYLQRLEGWAQAVMPAPVDPSSTQQLVAEPPQHRGEGMQGRRAALRGHQHSTQGNQAGAGWPRHQHGPRRAPDVHVGNAGSLVSTAGAVFWQELSFSPRTKVA